MNWKPSSDGWMPGDFKRPFSYGGKGVLVTIHEAINTCNICWTEDGSVTYVVVRSGGDELHDFGGVDLVSVNGTGEIRWVVRVDSVDRHDREAMAYFGLVGRQL